jgi:AcrR family transcriptional regulator
MPRPKKYNKEAILAAATELFWRRGYDGTSMDDLVKHSGLNRHSMYNEFGDKERLFLSCIDYYVIEDSKEVIRILTQEPVGLKNIEDFINNRVQYALSDDCQGCLLVNTVTEKEIVSDKINNKVYSILKSQENLIHLCLKAAQEKGEISKKNDCKTLTIYLSCFFRGLMSMGKGAQDKTSLNKLTEIAISAIKS